MGRQKQKLEWLELGRGSAAVAVFASHGSYADVPFSIMSHIIVWGEWGVAFFFILSGFIIFYVHGRDINNPAQTSNFAGRRFLRIFPTYWLVLLGYVAFRHGFGIDLSWEFFAKQIFLLPGGRLFLPVAWTLRHELLFYILFMLLILNLRIGVAAFAIWITLILFALYTEGPKANIDRPAWDTLTSHLNLYFFYGMALARACAAERTRAALNISVVLALLAAIVVATIPGTEAMLELALCGCVVAAFVHLSINDLRAPPGSRWFGSVSYPLYLVHIPAFMVAQSILKRLPIINFGWPAAAVITVVLAFAAAAVISRYFEKPILRGQWRLYKLRAFNSRA